MATLSATAVVRFLQSPPQWAAYNPTYRSILALYGCERSLAGKCVFASSPPRFCFFRLPSSRRDQCLGKIEVPLSSVKGAMEPRDMVMSLATADGATEPACGDLRVTVQLK